MKNVLVLTIVALTAIGGFATEKQKAVRVQYKSIAVTFADQPLSLDGKLLPFIECSAASKDKFGICFGNVPATSPVVEILDANNSVLQTLSVNDILGKGVSKEGKLLPNSASTKPRRVESVYTVRVQQHDAQVIIKALATGEEGSPDQQLVVTFAVKPTASMQISLRVKLPVTGNAEAAAGGFIVVPNSGAGAMAVSVLPQSSTLTIQKNNAVVSCVSKSLDAANEAAMLWLVIKGVDSSSPTDAKTQALAVIKDNALADGQPRLVVVNVADKERLSQADTASYSLVCANIGNAEATNVVLGNPIPKGSKYVDGSATTAGMVLSTDKVGEAQTASIQGLKWTLTSALKPGEERIVSFKVVVQ